MEVVRTTAPEQFERLAQRLVAVEFAGSSSHGGRVSRLDKEGVRRRPNSRLAQRAGTK